MFEASVDGEAYDMERWGQYFKPAGMGQSTGDPHRATANTSTPAAKASEDYEDEPAAPAAVASAPAASAPAAGGDNSRAQDILAMIRNRKQ
jgi:hypothetical protein